MTKMHDVRTWIGPRDFPSGPKNCITDVPGLAVGHRNVIRDEPVVNRTGVTIILPDLNSPWHWCYPAGTYILNGCGDFSGYPWIKETGSLQGPIALTSTASLGLVRDTIYQLAIQKNIQDYHYMPIVLETDDSWLSDDSLPGVSNSEVIKAIETANIGPSDQGNIGGGTGMICHEFKGGIGTASKTVTISGESFTLGGMVQANYGNRKDLRIQGFPIGRNIPLNIISSPWDKPRSKGSILVTIATDIPLLPLQCDRLAKRASLGLGSLGCYGHHDSGDIILCFSTSNKFPKQKSGQFKVFDSGMLDSVFEAVSELVHDAVWNALLNATDCVGLNDRKAFAIDHNILSEKLQFI
ncbi:MAG: P1 family peptidase [bacterium]|nr:P1 family peptidase [bacterium]